MAAFKAQGIDRNSLAYKSPFQPYFGYFSIFVISLVLIFKGFAAFTPKFDYKSFITQYIGAPIFLALYLGWKIYHKTSYVTSNNMDLITGARDLHDVEDEEEEDTTGWTWKQKLAKFWREI